MLTHDARSQVWSAAGRDAFAHWREVVCQAYTSLSPERLRGGSFAGDIRMTPLGEGGSLSHITASPQAVLRRRQDVSERPCDAVFVNIQVAGTCVLRQREIETHLDPGTFALLDARQPFAMRFDGPFRQVCLHLPMAWLEGQGFDPKSAIARRVDRRDVYGAALMDEVDATLADPDATDQVGHLTQLLGLCYADGRAETLADKHLALIQAFVDGESGDPLLSPSTVAAHYRISVRYLHRLFARSGTSFGRFLLNCRLHRSRRTLLLDPDRPIAMVGFDAGFRDPSHFARSFSRQYGMPPSAMRRLASGTDNPRS